MALMNRFLFFQLIRFGLIGSVAAIIHFSIVIFLVELAAFKPLYANVFAFFISFQVSYSGHRLWTFRGTKTQHRVALPKLLLLQITNFIANEGLFYIFLTHFNLPYPIALILVLMILPIATFTVSKIWIFR